MREKYLNQRFKAGFITRSEYQRDLDDIRDRKAVLKTRGVRVHGVRISKMT